MPEGELPFKKLLSGNFYQLSHKDATRIATRIFQIYDKDANKKINFRESKYILREIYKNFKPKKKISE